MSTTRSAVLILALSTTAFAPALVAADERDSHERREDRPGPAGAAAAAPDPFPRACVDCHLEYVERRMDVRLSTLMAGWREKVDPKLLAKARAAAPAGAKLEGRHPPVPGALASIPAGCLGCHGEKSTRAPPFARLMHAVHLTGGPENHFIETFQGRCTHCHKLDAATGAVVVPSGPEK
jgi:hypothetical protein